MSDPSQKQHQRNRAKNHDKKHDNVEETTSSLPDTNVIRRDIRSIHSLIETVSEDVKILKERPVSNVVNISQEQLEKLTERVISNFQKQEFQVAKEDFQEMKNYIENNNTSYVIGACITVGLLAIFSYKAFKYYRMLNY